MKLLLTSNGLKGSIASVAEKLLPMPAEKSSVAFVTTAAYGEDKDVSWLGKYREELRQIGIQRIHDVDLQKYREKELEKILQNSDVVYVNGGNTFFLLQYVRESGFDTALQSFLEKGGLYIGVSAGSIICSPTIEVAHYDLGGEYGPDKNNVGLTDVTAMGLVPFLISPHIQREYLTLVEDQAKSSKYPQVLIDDKQAVVVDDKSIKLVGEGEQITSNRINILQLPR